MLRNLIKIAFRNLLKDKAYSAINILGLTIGITCSLLLLMYIFDELSFDRYHTKADNIYRIVSNIQETDDAFTWAVAQMPLAEELRGNYPEVKNAVRFAGMNRNLYKNGDQQFYEEDFYLADSTVFDSFSYDFIVGDASTALDQPFNIVISQSTALKYFLSPQEAFNQSLVNQQNENFKITGVIKDVPFNSHFRFDGLVSLSTRPQFNGSWGNFGVLTYLELPADYDLARMQASLDKVVKEKVNPIFEQYGVKVKYSLQRITDIHLHSKIQDEAEEGGDISYIYIFASVAAFMILIACINYMNLATARSANRAKEVGLRKVMGSARGQLVTQFLTESVLMTVIALLISIGAIYLLLPAFNSLASKQLSVQYLLQPPVIISALAILIFTGIAGGSYPAFYLSSFNPANVLKGKISAKGGSVIFRKGLVVLQLALSIFMLITTFIVYDQLQFLRAKDLGFNKENLIRLDLNNRELQRNGKALVEQLKALPQVISIGRADASPGEGIGKLLFQVEDAEGKLVDRGVDLYSADYDFVQTLGMKLVQGRNFSKDNTSDTLHAVLVNESMVKRMAWKDPLGKKFVSGDGQNGTLERQVVGVIKDYNQNSLYDAIEPLIILLNEQPNYVFVRMAKGDLQEQISSIEKVWKETFTSVPFEFTFLDQDLDSQYEADKKRSQIFTAFSGLTIFIACLGLLGLAAYTTEQRTKEIGVRKVIGASVQSLVLLVAREFFLLIAIGVIIAMPVAWMFTDSWLSNFAYRIQLPNEWPTFLLSTVLALIVTIITVGYHVMRAATANPVKSLRVE